MSKRFTTITHSWSGGGGEFCVGDASACWGGSHPWPNGSPPPIFSWPMQMKIFNLKCLSKWFWQNPGERAWGGFHCVGGRGDDGGEAGQPGEQQDGCQPWVNKFNCDQHLCNVLVQNIFNDVENSKSVFSCKMLHSVHCDCNYGAIVNDDFIHQGLCEWRRVGPGSWPAVPGKYHLWILCQFKVGVKCCQE